MSLVGLADQVVARAAASEGRSDEAILAAVAPLLADLTGGVVIDLGCGGGALFAALPAGARYLGCDVVRYPGFPENARASFTEVDLNHPAFPIEEGSADAAVAIETIEHLENPRALVREMARMVRPGGLIVVTTPNQLSLLSKLSLLLKNEFVAFQEAPGLYPAHITALLESDLRRIAFEAGLIEVEVRYTNVGRIPGTARRWPAVLRGRRFSDNVLLVARRPR